MKRTRRNQGFTLIEILFAITLFALVSSAVNILAIGSMRQTLRNRHGTTAVMLAQQQAETVRGLPYDDIASGTMTADVANLAYTVDTDVVDDSPDRGMKQVTITVTWTGLEGTHSYEVETIVTAATT
jgi:prepilin-type N-terminal cleavage/methylation domain-containing protein